MPSVEKSLEAQKKSQGYNFGDRVRDFDDLDMSGGKTVKRPAVATLNTMR